MVTRPTWYLDVDGVVNAVPAPARRLRDQFEHTTLTVDDGTTTTDVPLWWRPLVVEAINTIARAGLARVVWLTTWQEQARTLLAPRLGLDPFDVATPSPGGVSPEAEDWWKVRTIRDHSDPAGRLVFTDDDLTRRTRTALRDRYEPDNLLLITPRPSPGLTGKHLSEITTFLSAT
ncbi:HAD domain-containing protein [Promicromonospora sp. NPDC057138]|uniref:HAD domain-containing protein n=1 Tax=Promicromonospora sp. NPDC057138 TaxID=3346031 RepID=UPI003645345E